MAMARPCPSLIQVHLQPGRGNGSPGEGHAIHEDAVYAKGLQYGRGGDGGDVLVGVSRHIEYPPSPVAITGTTIASVAFSILTLTGTSLVVQATA